jgi:hypothetical protein
MRVNSFTNWYGSERRMGWEFAEMRGKRLSSQRRLSVDLAEKSVYYSNTLTSGDNLRRRLRDISEGRPHLKCPTSPLPINCGMAPT